MKYYMIATPGMWKASQYVQRYPYHLVLAQVLSGDEGLLNTIKVVRYGAVQGCRSLILDNGAHEGIIFDPNEYERIAKALWPDIIVLPDLIGRHWQESRDYSMDFVKRFDTEAPYRPRFMFAGQGENAVQVIAAYDWAIDSLDPARFVLGFGQAYLQWCRNEAEVNSEGRRWEAFETITMHAKAKKFDWHILGGRWETTLSFSMRGYVKGLDSIKPLSCAAGGTYYPAKPDTKLDPASNLVIDDGKLADEVDSFCRHYNLEQ